MVGTGFGQQLLRAGVHGSLPIIDTNTLQGITWKSNVFSVTNFILTNTLVLSGFGDSVQNGTYIWNVASTASLKNGGNALVWVDVTDGFVLASNNVHGDDSYSLLSLNPVSAGWSVDGGAGPGGISTYRYYTSTEFNGNTNVQFDNGLTASAILSTNAPTFQQTNAIPTSVTIGTTVADLWITITNNGNTYYVPIWKNH